MTLKRARIEWITLGERKDERDMFIAVNRHKRCQRWLFHHAIQVSSSFFINYRCRKNGQIIGTHSEREVKRKRAMEWCGETEKHREPDLSEYAQLLFERKKRKACCCFFRIFVPKQKFKLKKPQTCTKLVYVLINRIGQAWRAVNAFLFASLFFFCFF